MINSYSVPLSQLVKEFNLRFLYKATDYEGINITVEDISRPGLQRAGYFDHFEPMRLQVIGTVYGGADAQDWQQLCREEGIRWVVYLSYAAGD